MRTVAHMASQDPPRPPRRMTRRAQEKETRIQRLMELLQTRGPLSLAEVERQLGVKRGTAVTDRREAYRRLGWLAPGGAPHTEDANTRARQARQESPTESPTESEA